MSSGSTVLADSKESGLGSSNQDLSLSSGKNTGIVVMPCHAWMCVPITISGVVIIFQVPECHLLQYFSVRVTIKNWLSQVAILSKLRKPESFQSYNSPKRSFANFWGLCSSFVECNSYLESSSPDILALS